MVTKAELIQDLQDSHERILGLVATIDPKQKIYPEWQVKHFLAHLAGWDEATTAALQSFMEGGTPDTVAYRGVDAYNANSVSTREELPLEHIIREYKRERQLFIEAVTALPDNRMGAEVVYPWGERGTVHDMIAGMIGHERHHAREITDILNTTPDE